MSDKKNAKNSLYNIIGTIVYFFAQWLTTVLVVRIIDFDTAGIYSLAIPFSNIFSFIARYGIRNFEVSDVTHRYTEGQYLAARLACAAASVVAFAVGAGVSRLSPYYLACYAGMMAFKLLEAFTDGAHAVFQRQDRYDWLMVSFCLKGAVATGGFLASLCLTHSLITSILAMVVTYLAVCLVYDMPRLVKSGLEKPCFKGSGALIKICTPLMLVSLTIPAMNYVTRYAISYYMNENLVGQYSSLSMVTVILSTFTGAVWVALIPPVSRMYVDGDKKGIIALFAKMMAGCAVIGIVAVAACYFLGDWAFSLVFGEEILESIGVLIPVMLTAVLLMMKSFFSAVLVPLEKRNMLLVGELAGCIVCASLAFPMTKAWGMYGANGSYMIGAAIQLVILAAVAVRAALHTKKTA